MVSVGKYTSRMNPLGTGNQPPFEMKPSIRFGMNVNSHFNSSLDGGFNDFLMLPLLENDDKI